MLGQASPAKKADKLTLTGLYNVLEALREGRELTAKEKTIHTQGLVGVLKELHDELDTAVLQAYGWADLHATPADTPELLIRLVALNARRAAEEKTGLVRWLRPEFQNPVVVDSLSNKELPTYIPRGLQADLALNNSDKTAMAPATSTTPGLACDPARAGARSGPTASQRQHRPATVSPGGQLQRPWPLEEKSAPHSGNAGSLGARASRWR
ncbi:hypothetical protein [Candidatus Aalborgicola defluviihabitans]|uniref:hypothetical protein n=1 Tax=Candidatus Aalborgicola defluviihabitans TaxID=3386187 RepID=UPI0039B947C5